MNTDHFPLIAKVFIKLKARVWERKKKWTHHKCTDTQRDELNLKLKESATKVDNWDYQTFACWTLKGENAVPKTEKRKTQPEVSQAIEDKLKERRELIVQGRWEEAKTKGKELKIEVRKEKRQQILKMVSQELDIRDQWMGLKMLRKGFNPLPPTIRNSEGNKVGLNNRAAAAATFLATKIWGSSNDEVNKDVASIQNEQYKIIETDLGINTDEIKMAELMEAIRKMKRGKTPGPDGVPLEVFKELHEEQLQIVLDTLNAWWRDEQIPDEAVRARVVLIFKKGDKFDLSTYRPISLLNTIYKLFACIVQKRISDKLDQYLQKTQYGFRKKRGTADALHYIRRMVDKGEMTGTKTLLVLLDWEKAFDKVIHGKLITALERMNIPRKLVLLISEMYRNPQFMVEMDNKQSDWKRQETGIRQGCPLSPYLFIILMSVMFWDIHHEGVKGLERNRVVGTEFDEVVYADDTICISESEVAMNGLLAAIEAEGSKYGMRLNKSKCEYLKFGLAGNVKFNNGERVKQMEEVKYLGCLLNSKGDPGREIGKRIKNSMSTLINMHVFFRHGDSSFTQELKAFSAVLVSKLMYGLESAMLNTSALNRLNAFQLKGLRKILHIPTTYYNRKYSNEYVLMEANKALQLENHGKLEQLSAYHAKSRKVLLAKLITLGGNEPSATITFDVDTLRPHDYGKKKVGRLRLNWLECTLRTRNFTI